MISLSSPVYAQDLDDEPDDRLQGEQRRLVAGLIQRGMPELVEEELAGAPTMHRVYIARAFNKAAIEEKSPETKERFFSRAAEEYRRVIDLSKDSKWMHGDRRRLDIAQWRVEFGDMILRHWAAADLDQFEITSGLKYDNDRLTKRLREAMEAYDRAGVSLEDLDIGLRTDEERYLLLGIAEPIRTLVTQQRLNRAWIQVYLAMIGRTDEPGRAKILDDALAAFDNASRTAPDPTGKYNALLGAGLALRESARFDEATSALERVIDSTAPLDVTTRAEYELARSFIAAKRFDDARRRLDRLASKAADKLRTKDAGAAFYIRLAPLVRGYSYMRESELLAANHPQRSELRDKAAREFESIASRGGSWPRMVQVYLDGLAGKERSIDQLSDVELLILGGEAMAENRYVDAEKAWRLLLAREKAAAHHHEARFNLGVCLFQRRDLRAAAVVFLEEVNSKPPANLSERVHEYAYRCWRQLAADSKDKEDYLQLADAAMKMAAAMPIHPLATEARWVAALSLDEGGDYRRAAAAYSEVKPTASQYWQARRNIARCEQRLFESLDAGVSDDRRSDAARRAADEWLKLANDLEALEAPATTVEGVGLPKRKPVIPKNAPKEEIRKEWISDARLAACSLLAGDELRKYREAMELLDAMRNSPRVLGMKIRCLQALGEIKEANDVLETYLKNNPADELGTVLVSLAAEMEAEVKRLHKAGRSVDARRMANETLPTIRHLLAWIESRPEHARFVSVVRFSLANMLVQADKLSEAMTEMEGLMFRHPANGGYIMAAARLQEKIGESSLASLKDQAMDKAEALWEKLLKDPRLQSNAPSEYWEARFHWLRHQLRHGRAAEVVKGIETEQAWHPELGGPPWQGLILELHEEAKLRVETPAP